MALGYRRRIDRRAAGALRSLHRGCTAGLEREGALDQHASSRLDHARRVLATTAADGVAQRHWTHLAQRRRLRWISTSVQRDPVRRRVPRHPVRVTTSMQFAACRNGGRHRADAVGEHAPIPEKPLVSGPTRFLRALWHARPDLRARIASPHPGGPDDRMDALLLQKGVFCSSRRLRDVAARFDHSTWTYLRDPIEVGATFTMQLLPSSSTTCSCMSLSRPSTRPS